MFESSESKEEGGEENTKARGREEINVHSGSVNMTRV